MSERKPGWYWVKVGNAPWTPSEISKAGHPCIAERGEDYEIGPRIPNPDEPWQCVPSEATPDMLDIQTLGYHTPASKRWRETLAVAPQPEGV